MQSVLTYVAMVALIRSIVEAVKSSVALPKGVVQALAFLLSFAAVQFYGVNPALEVGLKSGIGYVDVAAGVLILGIATMFGHDVLEAIRKAAGNEPK